MTPGDWVEFVEGDEERTWQVAEYHAELPVLGGDGSDVWSGLVIEKVVLYRTKKRVMADSD